MGGIKSKANKTNFNCQMLFALQGIENGTGSKVFYNSLCWLALSRPPVENVRPRKCMSGIYIVYGDCCILIYHIPTFETVMGNPFKF